MSVINDTVLHNFADLGMFLYDNLVATPQTSSFLQGSTMRIQGGLNRFNTAAATSTAVLPSILTGEASDPIVVVNDGANAIGVFAYPGENLRSALSAAGGTTGSISLPAGQSAIFIKSVQVKKGGVATSNPLNWSVGVIS